MSGLTGAEPFFFDHGGEGAAAGNGVVLVQALLQLEIVGSGVTVLAGK
jgi:hypothetical protein